MKAMILTQPAPAEMEPLQLAEVPIPLPGPGQILIQVQHCGVCHTDLHIVEGELVPSRYPVTPGHQVVGKTVAFGEGEVNPQKLRIGERVGVPWLFSACGECEFCLRGEENLCPEAQFTGLHVDGGYAEYLVADARYVLPLLETIPNEQAAPLLCAGIIGYRSLRIAGLQPGERIGLVGYGASAHLAMQVARFWGCKVYVFTRSDVHRQHARQLGADWVGGIEDTITRRLDRAVIFAPAGGLVPPTLEKLRSGGTLAINAVYMSDIPAFQYRLIYGERILRTVANATYQDGVAFLNLAAEIPLHATVSLYSLVEANRALQDLKSSRLNGEAVLVI